MEHIVTSALNSLQGDLSGTYYPLSGMTDEEQTKLIDDHFLFDKPVSPLLTCAGMARDWPDARGIWHNKNKNFLIWINEEDHTRVISMEKGLIRFSFLIFLFFFIFKHNFKSKTTEMIQSLRCFLILD